MEENIFNKLATGFTIMTANAKKFIPIAAALAGYNFGGVIYDKLIGDDAEALRNAQKVNLELQIETQQAKNDIQDIANNEIDEWQKVKDEIESKRF
ncbi:MAG: hypothetical protein H8D45_02005 [Bacteroidetes bacterium]|nr:hypothetical protein [Bacteroidota bacterium]